MSAHTDAKQAPTLVVQGYNQYRIYRDESGAVTDVRKRWAGGLGWYKRVEWRRLKVDGKAARAVIAMTAQKNSLFPELREDGSVP